jgi:hypothetical protein|tara:strand:+ start:728 stop:1240 length:513 start_codon:yes stop_codon:yes gene_type:complete
MEHWIRDLTYALRSLRRSPAFTASAVAALALGIGVNTAIFSVVNTVLLAPAPFREPDRLVILMNTQPQGTNRAGSPAKFMHWREQTAVLQDVAAFATDVVNYTGGDLPEQLRSAQVSADYFSSLAHRSFSAGRSPRRRTSPAASASSSSARISGRAASIGTLTCSARRCR